MNRDEMGTLDVSLGCLEAYVDSIVGHFRHIVVRDMHGFGGVVPSCIFPQVFDKVKQRFEVAGKGVIGQYYEKLNPDQGFGFRTTVFAAVSFIDKVSFNEHLDRNDQDNTTPFILQRRLYKP
ncbi:hypothetical protein CDEST_08904 [Colletotrichum destructivum]|uniref:Uncharacterized protein n=1 Tax=Colletotrichum destructivum TaxID=34406 RepID=A0AAX4IKA9_9PEZI|nr:hypothetical protein CDEST_08904 [Colletotrichum destructivum]